jgi:hypothetical protein
MANIKQPFERVYVPDREVDSLVNKLDNERFLPLFTPRKPKSGWSRLNKQRIAQLVRSGRMTPIGKAKDAAKKDGSWTNLDAIEHRQKARARDDPSRHPERQGRVPNQKPAAR